MGMNQQVPHPPPPAPAGPDTPAGEEWRLYTLYRPGAIYVHLFRTGGFADRPVRLSVAGLGDEALAVLSGLNRGQVVPRDLSAALLRVNRLA